jgi:hypothetical protein
MEGEKNKGNKKRKVQTEQIVTQNSVEWEGRGVSYTDARKKGSGTLFWFESL